MEQESACASKGRGQVQRQGIKEEKLIPAPPAADQGQCLQCGCASGTSTLGTQRREPNGYECVSFAFLLDPVLHSNFIWHTAPFLQACLFSCPVS